MYMDSELAVTIIVGEVEGLLVMDLDAFELLHVDLDAFMDLLLLLLNILPVLPRLASSGSDMENAT